MAADPTPPPPYAPSDVSNGANEPPRDVKVDRPAPTPTPEATRQPDVSEPAQPPAVGMSTFEYLSNLVRQHAEAHAERQRSGRCGARHRAHGCRGRQSRDETRARHPHRRARSPSSSSSSSSASSSSADSHHGIRGFPAKDSLKAQQAQLAITDVAARLRAIKLEATQGGYVDKSAMKKAIKREVKSVKREFKKQMKEVKREAKKSKKEAKGEKYRTKREEGGCCRRGKGKGKEQRHGRGEEVPMQGESLREEGQISGITSVAKEE